MESNHHLKLMRLLNYRYSNPLHIGLGGGNRTPATWPQTTNDTISPHRENIGALCKNRTHTPGLQNRTSTIKDKRAKLGGDGWNRATNLLRMKQMHYRCATSPTLLVAEVGFEPTISWLMRPDG